VIDLNPERVHCSRDLKDMARPYLEEVFKRSGIPTYTFVEPKEYQHLQVALRTPG
jgi:hypothetical protein